ncbi:MAG TPA: 3-dehydroquinate synthase [Clostridiales bacterium]|nr:3-dehydroquinate synthase [Clostridiales bacterium]
MKKLHVATGNPYDIIIDRNLLNSCGTYIKPLTKANRVMVISDSNVFPLYGESIKKSLENTGYQVFTYTFKAGEEQKRLSTINEMYNALADNGFTRKDLIVALGGGVTGDMAGFAAATYLRGIDFVQIPTSLLAQVDSSVGGKTGVDIPQGKNLVGAFWQPILVLIDPNTLSTLSDKLFADGMGEVIKYGCIKSRELFEKLERLNANSIIDDIIYDCVSIKRDVVQNDEREKGQRMLLNFGHTLAHAMEKEHNYSTLTHGEAVAIGMVMMTLASEQNNLTPTGTANRIARLCEKYSLPTADTTPIQKIVRSTSGDKKSAGNAISLIILKDIGCSQTYKIDKKDLLQFIAPKDKM